MDAILAVLGTSIRLGISCGQVSFGLGIPLWALVGAGILFSLRYRISRRRRS